MLTLRVPPPRGYVYWCVHLSVHFVSVSYDAFYFNFFKCYGL